MVKKIDTKNELVVLNQGWYTNGDIIIKTSLVDFKDEKIQEAKENDRPYANYENGMEADTIPDLEKMIINELVKGCSKNLLEDTHFIYNGSVKAHCFYDEEKERIIYIQEKYKKLFGKTVNFYASEYGVVVKEDLEVVGLVMQVTEPLGRFIVLPKYYRKGQ